MTQLDLQTPEQHRQRYEELRARARARAAARPQVGAAAAPATPPEEAVIARETVPGGWYWTARLARGESLRLVNTTGRAAPSVMLWNADDTSERYNAGDTVKLQWTALISKGRVLFSDMGRVLASIVEDTCGHNDTIVGGSTRASNQQRYGDASLRNTRSNLLLAAGKFGLGRPDVPPCITFFAGVRVEADGRFSWIADVARPGDYVDLRAEMNLLVAVSSCPHPLDPSPAYAPEPVEAVLWRSPPPAPDDLCRTYSEEAVRGFENTDRLFQNR